MTPGPCVYCEQNYTTGPLCKDCETTLCCTGPRCRDCAGAMPPRTLTQDTNPNESNTHQERT